MLRLALICALVLACCCACSGELSIHSMVVGGKVLEVKENRQLTFGASAGITFYSISPDGKTVAYFADQPDGSNGLCLIPSGGGRAVTAFSARFDPNLPSPKERSPKGERWSLEPGYIHWSPDSRLVACTAERQSWDGQKESDADCILLFTAKGAPVHTMDLATHDPTHYPIFDPSSTHIAVATTSLNRPAPGDLRSEVKVYDLSDWTCKVVAREQGMLMLERWADGGKSLIYFAMGGADLGFKKAWLDGKPGEVIELTSEANKYADTSSTGRYRRVGVEGGTGIIDTRTKKTVRTFKDGLATFRRWTSDDKLLLYEQPLTVADALGRRPRELYSLWMATAEPGKVQTMCIASECDWTCGVSSSQDGLRIAYTIGRKLYVAELAWRDATEDDNDDPPPTMTDEELNRLPMP